MNSASLFVFQFFLFLLIIFAAEVAAGIWSLSNKDTVTKPPVHSDDNDDDDDDDED